MKILNLFSAFSIFLFSCSALPTNNKTVLELTYPEYLKVIPRNQWGWMPIEKDYKTHTIKYITIHHGGVEFTEDEDPAQNVKNLQSWSRSEKNWVDIPYHFMIDLDGNIFETRPINIPGDTNTEYDPTGHALVEVMGNYEIQELNEKQLNSMIDLIKYLSERFEVSNENIRTHKDYSKMTVCPGKNIYKYFENGYILRQLSK